MAETSPDQNRHVAVFAFPYGTHAAPLLNLVSTLARAAPRVSFSFFTTKQSQHALFSTKPAGTIPENIKSYVISDGVPDGVDRPGQDQLLDLFLEGGPENLQEGLRVAVSETKKRVSCVISDVFVTSGLVVAEQLGVPWVSFWTSYSFALSACFHTDLIHQKYGCSGDEDGRRLDLIPGLSSIRVQDLPPEIKSKAEEEGSTFNKMIGSIGRVLPRAKAVAVNFYQELEPPELVQDLRSKMANVIYTGVLNLPLPPPSATDKSGSLSWLDQQSAKSVAYISLGTVVAPPAHELVAIAEALEESGVPFLWSLKDESRALLPNVFVEKSSTKGKLVPWAPQTLVLGHECVGVFVTHGGCNSVSESVSCGVPMICRPYFGDQIMAARMVEDFWEVGVKIEGERFTKNALMKSLKLVLVEREGKVMREKAQALKEIVLEAAGPKGNTAQQFRTLVDIVEK